MDAIEFVKWCDEVNRKCAEISAKADETGEKEFVTDDAAFAAEVVTKNLKVEGVGDALLLAAALNALNTFVKQSKESKKALGYSFKNQVNVLLQYAINHPDGMLRAELQRENDMSLAIIEINKIQFSFHQVTVTEKNKVLVAKDLDHPELAWDGIRKHSCAMTLFKYAVDNVFERTNKTMDGGNFKELLDQMLADFHDGKLTLEDSKKKYNAGESAGSDSRETGAASADAQATKKEYPLRNRNIVNLYQSDAASFISEIENRKLTDYIVKTYEESFGFKVAPLTKFRWKYAFESLAFMLKLHEVSCGAGIAVSYFKILGQEFPVVVIASEDADTSKSEVKASTETKASGETRACTNVALIQLLPWNKMKLGENRIVEYAIDGSEATGKALHPSVAMNWCCERIEAELAELAVNAGADENADSSIAKHTSDGNKKIDVFSCTLLYDAVCDEDSDIVSGMDEEVLAKSPVFYANDRKKLFEYVEAACIGENGKEILSRANKIDDAKIEKLKNMKIPPEHAFAAKIICDDVFEDGAKAIYIIDEKKAAGNTAYFDYLSNELENSDTKIYREDFPDSAAELTAQKNIILLDMDSLDEEQCARLASLRDEVMDAHDFISDAGQSYGKSQMRVCAIRNFSLKYALGFTDLGCGNNWLASKLSLCEKRDLPYVGGLYPISITDKKDEADVCVPESFVFDPEDGEVLANPGDRTILYRELLKFDKSVKIFVGDEGLRDYLSDSLNELTAKERSVKESGGNGNIVPEDLLKARNDTRNNSSSYNRYARLAGDCIGRVNWNKLGDDSRDWVVSALKDFEDGKAIDPQMDFSGVALMLSKTFEVELCERLAIQYIEYIKKKYGDDWEANVPDELVDEYNGERKIKDEALITLGGMPYIMGVDGRGNIKNRNDYDKFMDYARATDLFVECGVDNVGGAASDATENANGKNGTAGGSKTTYANVDALIKEMCSIIYYVRVNYRNTSAHKEAIDILRATECVEYCITKKRKLGVLLDMFMR